MRCVTILKPITEPVPEEPEPQCNCEVPAKILNKLGSAKCLGQEKKIEMQFYCDVRCGGDEEVRRWGGSSQVCRGGCAGGRDGAVTVQ